LWGRRPSSAKIGRLNSLDDNCPDNSTSEWRECLFNALRKSLSARGIFRKILKNDGCTSLVPQVSSDGKSIAAFISTQTSPGYKLALIPFDGGEPLKTFAIPGTIFRGGPECGGNRAGGQSFTRTIRRDFGGRRSTRTGRGRLKASRKRTCGNTAWSSDGRDLAYTSGPTTQEIIIIENFR
jgi:hypothetical protein